MMKTAGSDASHW